VAADMCRSDNDCIGGTNGRCKAGPQDTACSCTYDTCQSDSDCKRNQVCACAPDGTNGNTCLDGNCHIDSDCGGYYCSPALGPGCFPGGPLIGYYCHTKDDTCTNNSDCSDPGGYCTYQPELHHWACYRPGCAG
jgi:hypothetical protein